MTMNYLVKIVLQCTRQKLRANNALMNEVMDILQTRSQKVPGTNEDPVHGNRAPIKCRTWPCQVGTAREFIMWAALDGEERVRLWIPEVLSVWPLQILPGTLH